MTIGPVKLFTYRPLTHEPRQRKVKLLLTAEYSGSFAKHVQCCGMLEEETDMRMFRGAALPQGALLRATALQAILTQEHGPALDPLEHLGWGL